MSLFQTGPDRYQPAAESSRKYDTINLRALTLVVGLVAVGLPIVLYIAAHNPILETCYRFSISHYYYAPFWGTVFTGALVFIGTYLIVYEGEDAQGAEGRLATFAGLAAFGIAGFPTDGWGCDASLFSARPMTLFEMSAGASEPALKSAAEYGYFELFPYSSTVHYASATFLFGFLAWFALYVFTAPEPHQRNANGGLRAPKFTRNTIYIIAGITILLCMAAMAAYAVVGKFWPDSVTWWNEGNWTFKFEAICLISFGVTWLIKGRFLGILKDKT